MPDLVTAAATLDAPRPTPPAQVPVIKPGWQTTEFWALLALFGGVGTLAAALQTSLPGLVTSITALPNCPPLVAMAAPLVVHSAQLWLGWLVESARRHYAEQRVALKLDQGAAQAAGNAGAAAPLAILNS